MTIVLYLQDYLSILKIYFLYFNERYTISESRFLLRMLLRGEGMKEF